MIKVTPVYTSEEAQAEGAEPVIYDCIIVLGEPAEDGLFESSVSLKYTFPAMLVQNKMAEIGLVPVVWPKSRGKRDYDIDLWGWKEEMENSPKHTIDLLEHKEDQLILHLRNGDILIGKAAEDYAAAILAASEKLTADIGGLELPSISNGIQTTDYKCFQCGSDIGRFGANITDGKDQKSLIVSVCMNPKCAFASQEVKRF